MLRFVLCWGDGGRGPHCDICPPTAPPPCTRDEAEEEIGWQGSEGANECSPPDQPLGLVVVMAGGKCQRRRFRLQQRRAATKTPSLFAAGTGRCQYRLIDSAGYHRRWGTVTRSPGVTARGRAEQQRQCEDMSHDESSEL